jgi:hypothetical protein
MEAINQTKAVKAIGMRDALQNLIEDADAPVLKALGVLMLDRDWSIQGLERDLGSEAIESLLDETLHMDHSKLEGIHSFLNSQGVLKKRK